MFKCETCLISKRYPKHNPKHKFCPEFLMPNTTKRVKFLNAFRNLTRLLEYGIKNSGQNLCIGLCLGLCIEIKHVSHLKCMLHL